MHAAFPYRIDGRGRSAEPENEDAHVRELIEQVLFTVPGERVMRPDFGCGLMQLVFAPNSDELAATLQVLVRYTRVGSQESRTASFTQRVS